MELNLVEKATASDGVNLVTVLRLESRNARSSQCSSSSQDLRFKSNSIELNLICNALSCDFISVTLT